MTKTIRFIVAAWLSLCCLHAAGTVQQSIDQLGTTNNWVLAFRWTGDASTGTVPTTSGKLQGCCQGYQITQVETVPGTVAPTSGYNVTIVDTAGVDVLNGGAAGLSATLPQSFTVSSSAPPVQGQFSLTITGQSVASATGVVYVFLSKPGTVQLARLIGGSVPFVPAAPTISYVFNDPGPAWVTLNSNWASVAVNVGNYPSNSYFGNTSTGIPEAIRGSIKIPSSVNADGAHGAGVAGYALTASTTKGGVGVFGFGAVTGTNQSGWGLNGLTTNCGKPQCNTQTGFGGFNLQGIEIDVAIALLSGGATPTGNVYGFGGIGAAEVKPTGTSYVFHADALKFAVPKIGWDAVLYTEDGTTTSISLDLGTTGTGNGVGSQSINFRTRDGGGVARAASIVADSAADLTFLPGTAGQLIFKDASANIGAQLVPNGSAPYFYVPNQLRIATSTFAARPTAVAAGVVVLCTDCAAGCAAGAGTNRLMVSTGAGTTYTCP